MRDPYACNLCGLICPVGVQFVKFCSWLIVRQAPRRLAPCLPLQVWRAERHRMAAGMQLASELPPVSGGRDGGVVDCRRYSEDYM